MSKLYGWGAAVVIMGALFKINHYPGANMMLVFGLTTESIIFFFSAFEPPHVEPDWSLVYPELAGMYQGAATEVGHPTIKNKDLTKELDKMLSDAKIGPELIQSLSKGLHSLSENTGMLSDVSSAAGATNEYVKNVRTASQSVSDLTSTYQKTAEGLSKDASASEEYFKSLKGASASVANLSNTYDAAADTMKKDLAVTTELVGSIKTASDAARSLNDTYTKSAELLAKSASALDFSALEGGAFSKELQKISSNLGALNSVYEMQLTSTKKQVETSTQLQEKFDVFIKNLNDSIEKTAQYKDGVSVLAQNVASLNKVYGNILTAMNVPTGK
ncbi:MAG: gliding motility protein GldL [Bacteroidota bacterium]